MTAGVDLLNTRPVEMCVLSERLAEYLDDCSSCESNWPSESSPSRQKGTRWASPAVWLSVLINISGISSGSYKGEIWLHL